MHRFYSWLFILLIFPWFAFSQSKPKQLVLTDATIIDAGHREPLTHQTVLIRNGRIVEIYKTAIKALPDSAVVIDLKGKYLLPGLIDSHVHMATDPSGTDSRSHTLDVLSKMLYSGITTVRDMAGDGRILAGLARDAHEGEIISPEIYYSALMAGPRFFADPRTQASTKGGISGEMAYMKAVADTTNIQLAVAEAKGSGASGIKLYADLSAALSTKIIAEAKKQNIPVWSHAGWRGTKPSDLANGGCISISHSPLLIYEKLDSVPQFWKKAHDGTFWEKAIPALDDLFNDMKQHHTVLDATLLTYKKWADIDTSMKWDYEVSKLITRRAYKAGVTICAGTDDDQEQFVQDEIRLLVSDAMFSPFDAIVAATKNGASALHLEHAKGTIAVGMDADILILTKDPLINIDNIKSVEMVIKGGRIYKK